MSFAFDDDADTSILEGKRIAIVGYGNQGRSQALNLRDSGVDVSVGNIRDSYWNTAQEDGFEPVPIASAVHAADVVSVLLPDEVQPSVFADSIVPGLDAGKMIIFASGYNLYYNRITMPVAVDVAMVAPRMLGEGVRTRYLDRTGYFSFISVEQDASGNARDLMLGYARAIGSTRLGCLWSSAREETIVDLCSEQLFWGGVQALLLGMVESLTGMGCSLESVLLDLYWSGEITEISQMMHEKGFLRQIQLHSRVSQFGQFEAAKNWERTIGPTVGTVVDRIVDGRFDQDWATELAAGYPNLNADLQWARSHSISRCEDSLRLLTTPQDGQTPIRDGPG